MKILLIGANSYVGAKLYQDLGSVFQVIGTYHSQPLFPELVKLDITQPTELESVISQHKPDVIIHTANYASSRIAENNEENFSAVNLQATKDVVELANQYHSKLTFISSFAALNPDDIYGKLKLESEKIVATVKAGYLILRPSLIVGYSPNTTNDRPFNRILKCLDKSQPAEFDTSWKFMPTYLGHISQVIEQAIEKNFWNEIIPIVIEETVTQYQIAKDILSEFNVEVKPIDKKYRIPETHPDLSLLKKFKLSPQDYESMIQEIAQEIKSLHFA